MIVLAKTSDLPGCLNKKGDIAEARENYEKFLTLWKDADPGIAEVEDKIHEQTRQKVDSPTDEVVIKRIVNRLL